MSTSFTSSRGIKVVSLGLIYHGERRQTKQKQK